MNERLWLERIEATAGQDSRIRTALALCSPDDYLAHFSVIYGPEQLTERLRWLGQLDRSGAWIARFGWRWPLVRRFSFAVPSPPALDALERYAPILELGAGTGYWAYLLRQRGVDVLAYDKRPPDERPNHYFGTTWTGVLRGRAVAKARRFPRRTMFLCWPDYASSWAADALRAYAGDVVIYVGEGAGGACADDRFFDELERAWRPVEEIEIPQWEGIHDAMTVYQRRR